MKLTARILPLKWGDARFEVCNNPERHLVPSNIYLGIFEESLKLLAKKQHLLDFMTATVMPLSNALEGYELFDSMKVQKVIFDAEK
jgi:threonine dehydrogenase-like Zn-dependent dehydrogenase